MRKFTEVLQEYLEERERQIGDYYNNRYSGSKLEGRHYMNDLAKELNEMVQGAENEQTN